MKKTLIIRLDISVTNGAGYASVESKELKKIYKKNGPPHSFLTDNQMASLLVSTVMKELFENEIREPEPPNRPKQLTID